MTTLFPSVVPEAAAVASGNTDLTTWSSRPAGTTEGETGDGPNGVTYRWSAVASEWIRDSIYRLAAVAFVLDAKIVGDVTPANETPAWTETTAGTGTITSDGTRVSFDTEGTNSDLAEAYYVHGETGKNHFMVGHLTLTGISGTTNYLRWECRTGDYDIIIDPAGIDTTAFVRAVSSAPAEIGNRMANASFATEKWIEMYVVRTSTPAGAKGYCHVYVDNSADPVLSIDVADFTADALEQYRIGDNNSGASALYKVRDVKCGRWT
jgi:hypothetical protein